MVKLAIDSIDSQLEKYKAATGKIISVAFSIALGGSIYRTRWLYHPHRWLNLFAILTIKNKY